MTAPTIDFVDDEYIPPHGGTGGGRVAEPNPYRDIVAQIALQRKPHPTDPNRTVPVTKSFILEFDPKDDPDAEKALKKVRRQFANAGADNDPPVTVYVKDVWDVRHGNNHLRKDAVRIVFWTGPKVVKKSRTAPAVNETPEPQTTEAEPQTDPSTDVDETPEPVADAA